MKHADKRAVGMRMAEVRKSHNVTQEALAETMGLSSKHISHVETAASSFSLEYLISFCETFDCNMDYIMFGNDSFSPLNRLPEEIISVLDHGSEKEISVLLLYLDLYLKSTGKKEP